jgi:hypothetical protein
MARLLADPELRRCLGDTGHQLILEKFSADLAAQKYMAVYEGAVGQNRGDCKENAVAPSGPDRRLKVSRS